MHTTESEFTAEEPAPRPPSRIRPWLAGVLSVGLALALSELVTGLLGSSRSLVVSIGGVVIDTVPSTVSKWAIEVFGVYDKLVLVIGIIGVSLFIGAIVGRLAARRFWMAPVAFAVFGAVGLGAGLIDPIGNSSVAIAAAATAALGGLAALAFLLRTTPTSDAAAEPDRRAFFKAAGTVTALAVASGVVGRWLIDRMATTAGRSEVVLPSAPQPLPAAPAAAQVEVNGAVPVITPNDRFYKIDTALTTPHVDLADWTLKISGMVDRPFEMTYDELASLPMVERYVTLSCVSNEVGGRLVGNAKWLGVPLSEVLDRARVQPGATQIVGRSVDDFTVGFPTEAAYDGREALIAIGMNDEPLPFDHGFPARLVVAGLYGYVSATKWLSEIELTTWEDFDAYWVPRGWSKTGPIKTQSRIDVPRPASRVAAGTQAIAGVAWAPDRGIERVEVRIDEGPWQEAVLADPLSEDAWRQWSLSWQADQGEHQIQVRATDGTGDTQTDEIAPPRPDGATGYHTVFVEVV